jgi:CheY-like chemotaxis protein
VAQERRNVVSEDKTMHILLVEDDEVDVMNVRRAFDRNKIANPIYVAENGLEGLRMLRDGTVPHGRRLVLLDLNMPRMNGIEFLREVRQDPELAGLSVVVLTTSNEERDKIDAYKLNVAGYLLKPVTFINFVELTSALNKYWTLVEMP